MIRFGAPMKDRREKRQTTRSARRRFELDREAEGELHPAEIALIECEAGDCPLGCDAVLIERDKLRELFETVAGSFWEHGDIDWGDFQDKAEEVGLLVLVPGTEAFCAEWGEGEKMFTWAWSELAIDETDE